MLFVKIAAVALCAVAAMVHATSGNGASALIAMVTLVLALRMK